MIPNTNPNTLRAKNNTDIEREEPCVRVRHDCSLSIEKPVIFISCSPAAAHHFKSLLTVIAK